MLYESSFFDDNLRFVPLPFQWGNRWERLFSYLVPFVYRPLKIEVDLIFFVATTDVSFLVYVNDVERTFSVRAFLVSNLHDR